MTRDEAIDRLAFELNWIQQRLDPDPDGDWAQYDERDKEFFRDCIRWIMNHKDDLCAAAKGATPMTTETEAQSAGKHEMTKEWCMNMAKQEGDHEIGAGILHPEAQSADVTQEDRAAAWDFRPAGYGPADQDAWFSGQYDGNRQISAFARHRLAATQRASSGAEARIADPAMPPDTFDGDNNALRESIAALLAFDREGALVPHGIGGHAKCLLEAAYHRLGK
jgi:hypothetical protein